MDLLKLNEIATVLASYEEYELAGDIMEIIKEVQNRQFIEMKQRYMDAMNLTYDSINNLIVLEDGLNTISNKAFDEWFYEKIKDINKDLE